MENELNYLSEKIEELYVRTCNYEASIVKMRKNSHHKRTVEMIIQKNNQELEILNNILNALTINSIS